VICLKRINVVVDDTFRKRSDLLLTLFTVLDITYDVKQMSLAIGDVNDILVSIKYEDRLGTLIQRMQEHGLLRLLQSYESLTWDIIKDVQTTHNLQGA